MNEVHIWSIPLDRSQPNADAAEGSVRTTDYAALLHADERARASRFYFARDARRYTVGRAMLRLILSHYTELPPDTLRFTYNPYGNGVFVVRQLKKEDGSTYEGVRQIFVDIADKKGDLVAIREGIEAGYRVVFAGGSKLVDHSPVLINNEILPDAKVDPQPAEG